jgi:hypothetical protein
VCYRFDDSSDLVPCSAPAGRTNALPTISGGPSVGAGHEVAVDAHVVDVSRWPSGADTVLITLPASRSNDG